MYMYVFMHAPQCQQHGPTKQAQTVYNIKYTCVFSARLGSGIQLLAGGLTDGLQGFEILQEFYGQYDACLLPLQGAGQGSDLKAGGGDTRQAGDLPCERQAAGLHTPSGLNTALRSVPYCHNCQQQGQRQ